MPKRYVMSKKRCVFKKNIIKLNTKTANWNEWVAMCVYGVMSYGKEKCLGGVSIFLKVAYFEEWIEQTIYQNS